MLVLLFSIIVIDVNNNSIFCFLYLFFQIEIEIIKSYNITSLFNKDFILCESEVYFESYRHVYNVLKNITEDSFPMRNYIINTDVSEFYSFCFVV